MSKQDYFIPESGTRADFNANWLPVEARLKKILPLKDFNREVVEAHTQISCVDFSGIAECLTGQPDMTGLVKRFLEAAERKDSAMTVAELLARPAAELTRWRKMGNKVVLLPNALVLHMNSNS